MLVCSSCTPAFIHWHPLILLQILLQIETRFRNVKHENHQPRSYESQRKFHCKDRINIWLFLVNDIQTPPPLKKSQFYCVKNVAQCFETKKKSIFWFLEFLVFEIWSFKILRIVWKNCRKMTKWLSFALILLATSSKCVSENSKIKKIR